MACCLPHGIGRDQGGGPGGVMHPRGRDGAGSAMTRRIFDQPYLETCCRSALHRLRLCDAIARPPGLKAGPCLARLAEMGLARQREDGRYEITPAGRRRHALEIAPDR